MEKLTDSDIYTAKAAEHFGIDLNEVEPKHIQFIKDQEFALNYGFQGKPLLSYTIGEDGFVEFDSESSEKLVDQYNHRVGKLG